MEWKGNALTGICVAELEHARAEIAISKSVRSYEDHRKPTARGGKTYWNVAIFDMNPMRFDHSSVVDFTLGLMTVTEAKEDAAMILEWANCVFGGAADE